MTTDLTQRIENNYWKLSSVLSITKLIKTSTYFTYMKKILSLIQTVANMLGRERNLNTFTLTNVKLKKTYSK